MNEFTLRLLINIKKMIQRKCGIRQMLRVGPDCQREKTNRHQSV